MSRSVGMPILTGRESISVVTVTLEGLRITGEWESTRIRARAGDFPLCTNVSAAATGNQLLLKHPDGSVVSARIVRRANPEDDRRERD